jgi:hypothetical protein
MKKIAIILVLTLGASGNGARPVKVENRIAHKEIAGC